MSTRFVDAYLTPILVPAILVTNSIKHRNNDNLNHLYVVVTIGTLLSFITSFLNLKLRKKIKSRFYLTLITAFQLTATALASTIGYHLFRLNFRTNSYRLPNIIQNLVIVDGSSVFRHHFYADVVPGLLIFSQIQLTSIINYGLLNKAKRRFTFGEASIVSQLLCASYLTWAFATYTKFSGAGPFNVDIKTDMLLNIGIMLFVLVVIPYYLFSIRQTVTKFGMIGLSIALSYTITQSIISEVSNLDPLTWLVDYIFTTHQRISLFSLWLSTLTACMSVSTSWTRMVGQTNSVVRKVFHLAICVVFITGYNQDIDFTRFAAGGFVLVLFLLELVRAWQLPPIGAYLEKVCGSLRGKWDNRYLTISHIYLLVGAFIPLWIIPVKLDSSVNKLQLSSGLISIGVGDTAAAIIGTFIGRIKVADSGKTLEGLLGNLFSMILFKVIWIGCNGFLDEYAFVASAITTSVAEVLISDTCDNLTLPLVMILSMEIF